MAPKVVLAIVIFFVGDEVKSLLLKRQKSILSNLRQAEDRGQEAEKALLKAQNKYNNALNQVKQIQIQTQESIKQDQIQSQIQIQTDLEKLKQFQQSTINYQQQKIQKQLSQRILISVNKKVQQKLQQKLNRKLHRLINTACIELLALMTEELRKKKK